MPGFVLDPDLFTSWEGPGSLDPPVPNSARYAPQSPVILFMANSESESHQQASGQESSITKFRIFDALQRRCGGKSQHDAGNKTTKVTLPVNGSYKYRYQYIA